MGYIAAGLIALFVLGIVFAGLLRRRGAPSGRIAASTAILREEPSADEPTPARSSIASRGEAERAERKTPPA